MLTIGNARPAKVKGWTTLLVAIPHPMTGGAIDVIMLVNVTVVVVSTFCMQDSQEGVNGRTQSCNTPGKTTDHTTSFNLHSLRGSVGCRLMPTYYLFGTILSLQKILVHSRHTCSKNDDMDKTA